MREIAYLILALVVLAIIVSIIHKALTRKDV